jgi:hypothetical protein
MVLTLDNNTSSSANFAKGVDEETIAKIGCRRLQ